jgi:NADPH2:quinone reductase
MRVVEFSGFGGPEVLKPAHRDKPVARPGEIVIRVAAAGVNRPDVLQRQGKYPPPPDASDLPGLEVAGVVESVAPSADPPLRWRVGDRVMALTPGGGYAEFVAVPATQCLPVPAGLTLIEAAAMPETFFTVWSNVFDRGRLTAGETLLVHGGSSGIGTTAIQMARALGAHVVVTAGSAEKCAACERLGAALAINYRDQDFVEQVQAHTKGRGVDVILDMVGGDYLPRNLRSLADDGRLVQIAVLRGSRAELDLGLVMRRRLTVTGSTLRPRSTAVKAAIAAALESRVWPLVERGLIRPVIDRTFPLEHAADAHRVMEDGHHIGKLVLTVSNDA